MILFYSTKDSYICYVKESAHHEAWLNNGGPSLSETFNRGVPVLMQTKAKERMRFRHALVYVLKIEALTYYNMQNISVGNIRKWYAVCV